MPLPSSPCLFMCSIERRLPLLCLIALALPTMLCAQDDRGNPEDEFAIELPVFGRMIGDITTIKAPENGEEFGRKIWAVGSVDGDTLQDWIVSRLRCDTMIGWGTGSAQFPGEIVLYHGRRDGLPAVASGQRIGPSELGSETTLLASGDWDADGHIDLLLKYHIFGDTSSGLHNGGWVNHAAVFWGNSDGAYSLDDTTQLVSKDGGWGNIEASLSGDFDADGIADVLIWGPFDYVVSNGHGVPAPKMSLFTGSRKRWGRNGSPRTASWFWWDPPIDLTEMSFTDQDCDGLRDICMFYNDRQGAIARVSVLYGRLGMPDTADVQTVTLTTANGHFSLLSDVSGDGTADLVVNCGDADRIRIYAGRAGQRLLDQYRSGFEGATNGFGHWARPWAEILGPQLIHDGWAPIGYQRLYDLGDINATGGNPASEIWTFAKPLLVCYSGGLYMDSLIDATFDIRPGTEIGAAVRLGDIDGSGVPTIAVQYDEIPHAGYGAFPGGIAFIKANRNVPWVSAVHRKLPHIPGEACARISSVTLGAADEAMFTVEVLPNPSREEIRVRWNPAGLLGNVEIVLSDATGSVVLRVIQPAAQGEVLISARDLSSGVYFGSVRAGAATAPLRVVVP